jgi:hypothetical protein
MACKTCGGAKKGRAALGARVASTDGEGIDGPTIPAFGVRGEDGTVVEHDSYIAAFRAMRTEGGQLVTIEKPAP